MCEYHIEISYRNVHSWNFEQEALIASNLTIFITFESTDRDGDTSDLFKKIYSERRGMDEMNQKYFKSRL